MKTLTLTRHFGNPDTGEVRTYTLTIHKVPSPHDGRHSTQAVLTDYTDVVICDFARLGVRDAKRGRYVFWAGARIAFDRVIEGFKIVEPDLGLVREVRRSFQIALALAENDEALTECENKLFGLVAQRSGLLARQGGEEGPEGRIKRGFKGELEPKPAAYKAHASECCAGPSAVPDTWAPHGHGTPDGYYLKASPECSECQDPDTECCRRHGGVA